MTTTSVWPTFLSSDDPLDVIVKLSRFFGSDPSIVLAGGGNTSCKIDDILYVKGSGTALATMTRDGFVKMDRKQAERAGQRDAGRRSPNARGAIQGMDQPCTMRAGEGPAPVGRGVAASPRPGQVRRAQPRDDREHADLSHRRPSAGRADLRGRHRVGAVCRPRVHPRPDVEAGARRLPCAHGSRAAEGDPDGEPRPDRRRRRPVSDPRQHR